MLCLWSVQLVHYCVRQFSFHVVHDLMAGTSRKYGMAVVQIARPSSPLGVLTTQEGLVC